jgi:hypothetical protein
MAYIDDEQHFSVWWPGPLPEDLQDGGILDFMEPEMQADGQDRPAESLFGYIIRDWFGPFLLSPPARGPRGQC